MKELRNCLKNRSDLDTFDFHYLRCQSLIHIFLPKKLQIFDQWHFNVDQNSRKILHRYLGCNPLILKTIITLPKTFSFGCNILQDDDWIRGLSPTKSTSLPIIFRILFMIFPYKCKSTTTMSFFLIFFVLKVITKSFGQRQGFILFPLTLNTPTINFNN